jgi:hypothetical protein
MMGQQAGDQSQLFYLFNLEERIPAGHLLRRINPVMTRVLAELREKLEPFYSDIGDPEEWRGRGQPRAIGLDDVLIDRSATGGARRITRRDVLAKLGAMWATREEVAAFFNIHRKTLYNFFERCPEALVIYEDAKLSGNVSQRRRNVRLAETSAAMSIFLSKNQLGMRDDFAVSGKVDHEHTMLHVLLQELGDGTHGKVIQHDETER